MHMAGISSSYLLQCRYASRMCLVENAQHERIFAYIQSRFARTKPRVNCFVHCYCFVLKNLIVSSKSLFEILEKFFECLETRNSILETRFSILETRFSKLEPRNSILDSRKLLGSSFESRLSTYL